MRKTKIICTVGPATDDRNVMQELMLSGMDVARFNFSHGDHPSHKARADMIKELREELGLPIALLCDTKGPEIRTGKFDPPKVTLKAGQTYTLLTEECVGNEERCSISYRELPRDVTRGSRILIDDGLVEMRVMETTDTEITCRVINGGVVSSNKGINVPGVHLNMPYMSEKDLGDLAFAVENEFDFVAASFVRSADDVIEIRHELDRLGSHDIRLIAKIENSDGVENIDEIIHVSDGIMVARGDLGVEIPLEEIPVIQKMLIKKAYYAGKQVITATQMLDSMMKNPRPTRAESTDVANAIYDGTSAIMLSGETAAGLYPVEAVRTMANIATRAEMDIDYVKRFNSRSTEDAPNVTNAISHASCTTAHDLGAKAIITVSKSGRTVRMLSKYRPNCPIIGCTTEPIVWRQMNLSWGVYPLMVEEKNNTDELFDHVVDTAVEKGLLDNGDLVVITAGVPLGVSGTTNLLKVHLVGNVLVTGTGVSRNVTCGNLCVCQDEAEVKEKFRKDDILVVPQTTNDLLDYIRDAKGIITEQSGLNSHAAIVGLALDKPVIVGALNATKILKSGTTVTVDASRGIVYSGNAKQK